MNYYLLWSFLLFSAVLVNGQTVFVSIPPQYATGIISAAVGCIQKTGVPPDILQQLLERRYKDTDQLRKFIYCFGTTSGYVDNTGHYKTDMVAKLVGNNPRRDQFVNTVDECNKSIGKDKYEKLFKTSVCIREKSPIIITL